jgi:hypothetical protein
MDPDGLDAVLMALGSLCGATGYYQWESAVLARRIELSATMQDVPPHEFNLLCMAQKRANMETGYELTHHSDGDR